LKKEEIKRIKKIYKIPYVLPILNWSRNYSPPGFSNISLYQALRFVIIEAQKESISTRANSVAFSLFLSIFPAIIFIFTLLPLIPWVQDYTSMFSRQLKGVIPDNAHAYIFSIIHDLTSIKRDGLLSLGAILALIFSSNGMVTLMSGFDKAYNDTFKPRPWWITRLIAMALTGVLTLLLILSLIIVVVQNKIVEAIQYIFEIPDFLTFFIPVINWTMAVGLIYTGISIIYRYGPSMHRRISFFNVGSILATILSLSTSLIFSSFINNFGKYNEIYGSIGALIVMMVWIQLNSYIILIGFELNASLAVHKTLRYLNNQKLIQLD
jgi:membrane protein